MLEALITLAFEEAVSQLPPDEKQVEIETVFSPHTYFSAY
jgi:hypothetical protein